MSDIENFVPEFDVEYKLSSLWGGAEVFYITFLKKHGAVSIREYGGYNRDNQYHVLKVGYNKKPILYDMYHHGRIVSRAIGRIELCNPLAEAGYKNAAAAAADEEM